MIVTSEMIVTFQLIEKREEEIDLKIVRNGDVIEGKFSVSDFSTTEVGALTLLVAGLKFRILLSLPS